VQLSNTYEDGKEVDDSDIYKMAPYIAEIELKYEYLISNDTLLI
jgi:hypothetical protein